VALGRWRDQRMGVEACEEQRGCGAAEGIGEEVKGIEPLAEGDEGLLPFVEHADGDGGGDEREGEARRGEEGEEAAEGEAEDEGTGEEIGEVGELIGVGEGGCGEVWDGAGGEEAQEGEPGGVGGEVEGWHALLGRLSAAVVGCGAAIGRRLWVVGEGGQWLLLPPLRVSSSRRSLSHCLIMLW
jgi:hypothetical protein